MNDLQVDIYRPQTLKLTQGLTFWLQLCTVIASVEKHSLSAKNHVVRQSLLLGMVSSLKKVVIRKWDQQWLPGYLPPASFLRGESLELLDLAGKIQAIRLADLKWACFVRDFNSGEMNNPERLIRKTFAGRPRASGLWVRTSLSDGDTLEGLADNDISLVTAQGIFLVPPDTRSNTQRVFLPANSIVKLEVLSVIGAAAKGGVARKIGAKPGLGQQPDLF